MLAKGGLSPYAKQKRVAKRRAPGGAAAYLKAMFAGQGRIRMPGTRAPRGTGKRAAARSHVPRGMAPVVRALAAALSPSGSPYNRPLPPNPVRRSQPVSPMHRLPPSPKVTPAQRKALLSLLGSKTIPYPTS